VGPIILRAGEGESFTNGPWAVRFLASAETATSLAVLESTLEPGFLGPELHFHQQMTDCFYVLEGTVTFIVGERTFVGDAGSFVLVPPSVLHTFANRGDVPARVLNVLVPPGLEGYLRELADSGETVDPETMARLASKHDFHRT
jgi:quercetin dioxygenase-like cupin family protein